MAARRRDVNMLGIAQGNGGGSPEPHKFMELMNQFWKHEAPGFTF